MIGTRSSPKTPAARRCVAALVAVCAAVAMCVSAGAAIPAGPDAPTMAKYREKSLAFETRLTVDVYRQAGTKSPIWDDRVIAFLTAYNRFVLGFDDAPALPDLERQARLIYLDGCDDPLVLACYGHVLVARKYQHGSLPILVAAADKLPKSPYKARVLAGVFSDLVKSYGALWQTDDVRKTQPKLVEAVVAAATDGAFGRDDREILATNLLHWMPQLSSTGQASALDGIRQAAQAPDAVVLDLLDGSLHVDAAWERRGGGTAGTVGAGGWRGFEENLAAARAALTRAWRADPTLVYPAGKMIVVCMGEGQQDEARVWFDRAVAARLDHPMPYEAYFRVLMPRWGSSPQKLLAFGTECAATGRYDTEVPFFLYRSLQFIRQDSDGSFEPWSQFSAYPALEEVALKTAAAPEHHSRAAYYQTIGAAAAARRNQFEKALKLIKELDGRLDATAVDEMGFRPDELRGKVYAMTGPSARPAINAEICRERGASRESAGFYDDALEPYLARLAKPRAAAAATRPSDPFAVVDIDTGQDAARAPPPSPEIEAARYLRSQSVAMHWQTDFAAGKEVQLTSRGDLAGWWLDYGRATADPNGDLIGRTGVSVLRIHCLADFGREWEMSLEIAFLRAGERRTDAGVLMFPRDLSLYHSVRFYRNVGQVIAETGINVEQPEPAAVKPVNRVTVISHGGKVSVRLNGRLVLSEKAIDRYDLDGDIRVGLCAFELGGGDVVRFGDVRIKKLTAR